MRHGMQLSRETRRSGTEEATPLPSRSTLPLSGRRPPESIGGVSVVPTVGQPALLRARFSESACARSLTAQKSLSTALGVRTRLGSRPKSRILACSSASGSATRSIDVSSPSLQRADSRTATLNRAEVRAAATAIPRNKVGSVDRPVRHVERDAMKCWLDPLFERKSSSVSKRTMYSAKRPP
jgi:hypothetical protein